MALNETHDTGLQSWVASANTGKSDFPIQNLPFAVLRRKAGNEAFRGGVAIGDQVLDMAAVRDANALPADVQRGDIIAVAATGAYGRSMASNYNNILKPPVIAVQDGASRVIVRRETEDDLLALDVG